MGDHTLKISNYTSDKKNTNKILNIILTYLNINMDALTYHWF